MSKIVHTALIGVVSATLAACGGGAGSGPPAGGVPASSVSTGTSGPAKPSAASPAAAPPSAAAAPVQGPKAPGPFTASGTVDATGGQAGIQASDALKWQPDVITAKAGSKVTLSVQNTGNTAHNFVSPALNVAGDDIAIQKTTPVNFTVPSQPGTYQFWCNIPGHAEAGMVGEIIVQ